MNADKQAQGGGELDYTDIANRAQEITGRSIWPSTVKAVLEAAGRLTPPSAPVGAEGLAERWKRDAARFKADGYTDVAIVKLDCAQQLANLAQQPAAVGVPADVVREYLDARACYEAAIRPPNSHAPAPVLRHDNPDALRLRNARIALDSALAQQPPAEAQAQGGGEVCEVCDGGPGNDGPCLCGLNAPPSAPVGVEGESVASYIDRLGERIRHGMMDVRRFGANASFGTYMDDLAAEAIAYAAALAQQPEAEAQRCTCPSGDGSLRWPCPAHPAEAHWKVGRFHSSHTPKRAVLVLSVGAAIERDEQHHSFIEWVYSHPAEAQAQGGGEVVAWAEKDGDEWVVHDAASEVGQHIRDYQSDTHFKSVFPIYDRPAPSAPVGVEAQVSALQSVRDRMVAALTPKFGDAFDGDFDVMLEAINTMKRFRMATLAQQPAAVDGAMKADAEELALIAQEIGLDDPLSARILSVRTRVLAAAFRNAKPGGSDNDR